ncbi:hypothetical protein CLCR_09303 [Cladophialophora carrionii]|uniref:Uncharacterized protein n=1 Tax=Cladophialophora carrionii TaxID=86049 RepID=A0A1C1CTT9_9EURO|nr:hypothetical protein CLCR_09303 [Cladophialophora carrionii]
MSYLEWAALAALSTRRQFAVQSGFRRKSSIYSYQTRKAAANGTLASDGGGREDTIFSCSISDADGDARQSLIVAWMPVPGPHEGFEGYEACRKVAMLLAATDVYNWARVKGFYQ